jgi:uncharacterized cupredoxin-like copper-binding protein
MSVTRYIAAAAVLSLSLAPAMAADDYITNAGEIVSKADWKAMQTVTVVLDEHSYAPEILTLEKDKPYKLVIQNKGAKDHYFTAPDFFKSIATRKAQTKDGEIKAPYFTALEAYKNGGAIELFFVPVKNGTFPVYCTIDDHKEKGMEGKIVVK